MSTENTENLVTYSVSQVAEKLHVPVRTIQRWCELDVLLPESGTHAGGKGKPRRLNHQELQVAAVLAAMSEKFVTTHSFKVIAGKLRRCFFQPESNWVADEPFVDAHRRVLFCEDERTPWLLLGFRIDEQGQEEYEIGVVNRPAQTTFAPQEGGGGNATIQGRPLADFKTVELFNLKKILTPVLVEQESRQADHE
jgi:MerR HTH family regulatory protein